MWEGQEVMSRAPWSHLGSVWEMGQARPLTEELALVVLSVLTVSPRAQVIHRRLSPDSLVALTKNSISRSHGREPGFAVPPAQWEEWGLNYGRLPIPRLWGWPVCPTEGG